MSDCPFSKWGYKAKKDQIHTYAKLGRQGRLGFFFCIYPPLRHSAIGERGFSLEGGTNIIWLR